MLNVGNDLAPLKHSPSVEVDAPSPSVAQVAIGPPEENVAGPSRSSGPQTQELERLTDHLFSLPLHTDELGRLPIYDPFHYEFTFHYQLDSLHHDAPSGLVQPELFNIDRAIGNIHKSNNTGYALIYSVQIQFYIHRKIYLDSGTAKKCK
jgi:hypothetical protein